MLMEIRRNPITRQGKRVSAPVFHANCLEEVCGACTMVINGRVRQACTALAVNLPSTTTLEPMSKFPRISSETQQFAYLFSRCMTCGCCLEACPQVNSHSKFMGPAVMGQVYLMSQHPTGAMHEDERLAGVMGEGGIEDCGNAQNCVEVCPKDIPLTTAIGWVGRKATVKWLRDLFMR